jgi:hypothetical protein
MIILTHLQGHDGRDVFDKSWDTENHVPSRTILLDCTINLSHNESRQDMFPFDY